MTADEKTKILSCSFCGKSQHDVEKLVAGSNVYICNECVDASAWVCMSTVSKSGGVKITVPYEYLQVIIALGINVGSLFREDIKTVEDISKVSLADFLVMVQNKMKEMFGTGEATQASINSAKEKMGVDLRLLNSINEEQTKEIRKVNARMATIRKLVEDLKVS